MEFYLGVGLLMVITGLLSAAISFGVSRLQNRYAKPLAIIMGILLFIVLTSGSFVGVIVVSAQQGHPF